MPGCIQSVRRLHPKWNFEGAGPSRINFSISGTNGDFLRSVSGKSDWWYRKFAPRATKPSRRLRQRQGTFVTGRHPGSISGAAGINRNWYRYKAFVVRSRRLELDIAFRAALREGGCLVGFWISTVCVTFQRWIALVRTYPAFSHYEARHGALTEWREFHTKIEPNTVGRGVEFGLGEREFESRRPTNGS